MTDIQQKGKPQMKKLTTAIATDMVDRIEALQNQIGAIYAEANQYDGMGNSNVIRDAVKARNAQRESEFEASALLSSFDASDDRHTFLDAIVSAEISEMEAKESAT